MKTYALSDTSAAPSVRVAQDLNRHTPRAAANHLSPLERAKLDASRVDEDAAAFDRMAAKGSPQRPLKPPGAKR